MDRIITSSSDDDNSINISIDIIDESADGWNVKGQHLNDAIGDKNHHDDVDLTNKLSSSTPENDTSSIIKEDLDEVKPRVRSNSSLYFDLLKIPMSSTVQSLLSNEDFYDISHLCNGSHSNIHKANMAADDDDKAVILKVLSDDSLTHQVALQEFEREINILSRTNHSHIIDLYGHGKIKSKVNINKSKPLIALEYLEGNTLSYHLKNNRYIHDRPFTELRYLRIAKEFADALYYLHDKLHTDCKLIHRDLKPDNVGFTSNGTLKIMDFGLCICLNKSLNDHHDQNTYDNTTYELTGCTGSLRYMAPEVALYQPYNEKVDIYGFGMILYEIITGVAPFTGTKKDDFYQQVVVGNLRPNIEYDGYGKQVYANPVILTLMQQCWDVNFTKRPSAKTLVEIITQQEQLCLQAENQKTSFQKSMDTMFRKTDPI